MIIAIISCSKKKKLGTMKAKDIYSASDFFNKCYTYAKKHSNKVLILSSKYGLIKPDDIISTYEETLNGKPESYKKDWAIKIIQKLKSEIGNSDIIWLAGNNYRKYLMKMITNKQTIPLKGLGIGKQLKYLKDNL